MPEFHRLMKIVEEALSLPVDKRSAFVRRECEGDEALRGEAHKLIEAAASGFLEAAPIPPVESVTASFPAETAHPETIAGRYSLVEKIGEGGMGQVWAAKQSEPVKRKVAIKLIKKGMDSRSVVARFEQERQALAVMDHPNIAKVLDGGLTDSGQPFFVMELVAGRPLTKFCDEMKLNIDQRLELFVPICQAVQHAHQKGIIHRDLKPANILVSMVDGKPTPKIIDFGVAKAIAGKLTDETLSTQHGVPIGTLEYMAPEQTGISQEDVDTRADVYSLGVVLYELLTGLRPFDSKRLRKIALDEVARIIREEDPPSLSSRLSTNESLPSIAAVRGVEPKRLVSLVSGELGWIVLRCLEKDRDRRYETANGVAREIQRYLSDEPVEARPTRASYRIRKFVRRHQSAVLAGTLVFAALVLGVAGTSWQAYLARTNERLAVERLQQIESEQQRTLEQKKRAEEGERIAAAESKRAIASEAAAKREKDTAVAVRKFLQQDLLNQGPWQQAKIRRLVDSPPSSVKLNPTFRDLLETAAKKVNQPGFKEEFRERPEVQTEFLTAVADSYQSLGEFETARSLLQKTLALNLSVKPPDETTVILCRCRLAAASLRCFNASGAVAEAIAIFSAIERNIGSPTTFQVGVEQLDRLFSVVEEQIADQPAISLDFMEETDLFMLVIPLGTAKLSIDRILKVVDDKLGPADRRAQILRMFNAFAFEAMKQKDEAIAINKAASNSLENGPGKDAILSWLPRLNLARLMSERGEFASAATHYERLLEKAKQLWGSDHPNVATLQVSLGLCNAYAGRANEAIELLEPATKAISTQLGAEHPEALSALGSLGVAYRAGGRFDEAIRLLQNAIDVRKSKQPGHPQILCDRASLGVAYLNAGRLNEAIRVLEQVRDERLKEKSTHSDLWSDYANLGRAYMAVGRLPEAVVLLRKAAAGVDKDGFQQDDSGGVIQGVVNVLEATGELREAEGWRRKWTAFVKKNVGPQSRDYAIELMGLGSNLIRQKNWSAAEPILREGLDLLPQIEPQEWRTFNAQSVLGKALLGQKKYVEAEPLLLSGFNGLKAREKSIPKGGEKCTPDALDALVELYAATNKPEEATKWKAERAKYGAAPAPTKTSTEKPK